MQDLSGQNLGQYRIIEPIGKGGMASVFKAYQPALDRYVAIKVLPPYHAHEPGFTERFEREAKAVAQLNHHHILPIYDYGQEGDLSYIMMQYVEGGTLKDMMSGPMPLDKIVRYIGEIASALDYAHEKGIVHRDVKPSNVLIDRDRNGWSLLSDFGLAKMVEGVSHLTGSGVGVGTPQYMPPEQGQGGKVDQRADIYSLGVVLYEMATGRVPFEAETPLAVVLKHITDPLPLPSTVNPDVPEGVERVVLKAMAKEPDDRFGSAGEMADVLQEAVGSGAIAISSPAEVEAKTLPLPAAEIAPPTAPDAAPPSVTPAPAALPRRRGLPWLVVIGALALAGVIAALALTCILARLRANQTPRQQAEATAQAAETLAAQVLDTATVQAGSVLTRIPMPTAQAKATPIHTPVPASLTPAPVPEIVTMTREADGAVMVYVPEGKFTMGSPEDEGYDDEHPQHTYYLDAFWIDQTEVTNAQYYRCVEAGACEPLEKCSDDPNYGADDRPVVCVSWDQATAYAEWVGGRLPTEAEWEKAARGPDGREYPWGNEFDGSRLNFCDKSCLRKWRDTNVDDGCEHTAPVGSYPAGASPYGALDMAGNVYEWTYSAYKEYPYDSEDGREEVSAEDVVRRVVRGGDFDEDAEGVRCAHRLNYYPFSLNRTVGFRVVVSP
jgi:formylglycine-generating enzyme required for sulfatase activity